MSVLRWAGRHRRGGVAALVLAVTAGVIVALVLVAGSPSPTNAAGAAGAAKAATGAATVKRRDLVQTDTESGTLSYANPQTVYDRLSGTITWLPGVGQTIKPGGTLFRVNGQPVTLMNGNTPAYRDLNAADSDGADVLELNRNLSALGFNANGITVDDVWQPATTLGVELLQESLGESPTGSLSLGTVVFLPGPQLVSTVDGTVGDTTNGGGATTQASLTGGAPAPEYVGLTTPGATLNTTSTTTTGTTSTPTPTTSPSHPRHKPKAPPAQEPTLAALEALLKAESAQLKAEAAQLKAEQHQNGGKSGGSSGGSKGSGSGKGSGSSSGGSSSGGSSGSGAGASSGSSGTAVLETTSTHLVVTVDLDASLQSEAKVGERVSVQLPAGNTVNGKVTAVSSVAQSSSSGSNGSGSGSGSGGGGGGGGGGNGNGSGSGSASTIPVTVTLMGHHRGAGLDEAAVSVNFAQQRANHVLSVPVTALIAVSGGNYDLQEASPPHTLIPVTVGLFAAGYVQVSGPGIHTGLQVTDSQG